jgi:hypothetical protein
VVVLTLNRRSEMQATLARRGSPIRPAPSLMSMCRDLPPVVYFIRTNDGLIKIGHTVQLDKRRTRFGSGWQHILAVVPGTRQDEADMHSRFSAHLARGAEYFHPAPELIAHINEVRATLGVSPII